MALNELKAMHQYMREMFDSPDADCPPKFEIGNWVAYSPDPSVLTGEIVEMSDFQGRYLYGIKPNYGGPAKWVREVDLELSTGPR